MPSLLTVVTGAGREDGSLICSESETSSAQSGRLWEWEFWLVDDSDGCGGGEESQGVKDLGMMAYLAILDILRMILSLCC